MEQLMNAKKLAKKFVNDIMFQDTDFCRVNVEIISRKSPEKNISRRYMVKKDEGIESLQTDDSYKVYYSIRDKHIYSYYTFNNGMTTFERVNDEGSTDVKEYYIGTGDSDIILLTVFRYSNNDGVNALKYGYIIYPVIYRINNPEVFFNNKNAILQDILEDFMDGCNVYSFLPVFTNTKYVARIPLSLNKNDNQINEGFDITSTAEYFEVEDIVGEIEESTRYSWNPNTCILSANTYNEEEYNFYIDLYYVEDLDESVIDKVKSGNLEEKIFSYSQSILDPTECYVTDKEFYWDDHIECGYTCDPDTDKLENLNVTLNGKEVINADIAIVNDHNTITINNVDDGTVLYTDLGDEGFYTSPELSFSCVNTLANIIYLNSFVYDYDNLYMRSIAWNLIKIK